MRGGLRPNLHRLLLTAALSLGGCADDDPNAGELPPTAANTIELPAPQPLAAQPIVLLVLDTSGSMERRLGCTCETPGCTECLPDCGAGQRSRYLDLLEALTGSFQQYGCDVASRQGDYDRDYGIAHVQLRESTSQAQDGLLDRFGGHARFAIATMDSMRSYGNDALVGVSSFDWQRSRGPSGMFSYAGSASSRSDKPRVRPDGSVVGKVFFPGASEPFLIDTGLRGADASEGALIIPGLDDTAGVRASIAQQLRDVRPFGGSPTAAALDDAYFALTHLSARQAAPHAYAVLITDGPADDDFRQSPSPGCACANEEACGEDPAGMSCPYPLPADAAQHLRCGFSKTACAGPLDALYVLGLGGADASEREELDGIAAAGGSTRARFASDASELRTRLDELLTAIVQRAR